MSRSQLQRGKFIKVSLQSSSENDTGSDIFSVIWSKKLIDYFEDDTGHSYREVLSNVNVRQHIDNLGKQKFQSRDEYNIAKRTVIEELCNTVFTNEQCEILRDILWRISDEDGINPDYLKQYEEDLKRKEGRRKYYEYAKPFLNQLDNSEFLKRDTIKQKLTEFLKSQKYEQKILDNTQNLILENLHHGSYAACVYKFRCDCTHRFDGQNQCFSNVTYNGKLVENINFDLLVNSYNKVLDNLKKKPIEEIKIMYDKYAKSQEGISGLIPVFQAYINDFLKT